MVGAVDGIKQDIEGVGSLELFETITLGKHTGMDRKVARHSVWPKELLMTEVERRVGPSHGQFTVDFGSGGNRKCT